MFVAARPASPAAAGWLRLSTFLWTVDTHREKTSDLTEKRRRCHAVTMAQAAKKPLDEFDSLPQPERQEVLLQLLRRAAFDSDNSSRTETRRK